ncbi:MAG: 2-heptaprenyl-1,4-naphthoquinone methyltransferase [Anaerolineales bacterium]|nr:methyltransferase domain-containing protein [Anaerolineae bacterium]PWB55488.1 MAG: 2-heptaprenyl-1,4-naphthoquinone methyltransferase [Anaerolineales bacterium]
MPTSPVTRSKSAARQTYNRLSGVYDLLAGSSELPLTKLGLQMLAVRRGERVLELGCGTGHALAILAEQAGDVGWAHGIDLSSGMLHQARRHLVNKKLAGQVSLLEGDGARLPYPDNCLDAIFLSFTLELFDTPEIPLVLAECLRVLRTGGHLGVVSLYSTGHPNWIVRLYEWFHAHLPAYVDCRPINAAEWARAAGLFVEKQTVKLMWGLPVEILLARKT